jgi:glycosyltransferase involved in cell wall biosynthesis
MSEAANVCLLLEGTYPYVSGGVSSWVHDVIGGLPELRFALYHIASREDVELVSRYTIPPNVVSTTSVFCAGAPSAPLDIRSREKLEAEIRERRRAAEKKGGPPSRLIAALRRLHLGEPIDRALLEDLASADRDLAGLLHGREAFELCCELGEKLAPKAPFLHFFWHFRSMHTPVLRLLHAPPPAGDVFHAVSTGYAGLVGAIASVRTGRPLLLTEHGIYTRERDMELARAPWLQDSAQGAADPDGVEQLRRFWSRFFGALSRITYARASSIVTLSEGNRRKQIADGADPAKIAIVPNGVDLNSYPPPAPRPVTPLRGPLRVGFVGRLVPIKDVLTLIKACHAALQRVELDVRLIGPDGEDPAYAARCRALVEQLGRGEAIRFVGPKPPSEIYGDLDVVVLTSHSEGQPLVILEAYANAIPVVSTDVGACREMIEGRTLADRRLGPSGFVTHIATPAETADALVQLASDPALRRRMGAAGRRRVAEFYRRDTVIDAYRDAYGELGRRPTGAA